ncbi:unnamed protein product [Microthlaspi erraticum]|uniref:Major facilitator superfamily (MFS) profile domain-containing protein n=1 Tax=Microthlaspi erraticum TaxID=1685480 RepID=A0A6D2I065_9BRAS|nr:unnamed protein product [Microthlaspi erraticum]
MADTEAPGYGDPSPKRGGWITFPFMMVPTLLGLSIASFGWIINLIVFLIEEFNIKNIAAAQISNIVNGCISMFPFVAAILADSFFRNIPSISASALISLLGIVLLTLIAFFDNLRPQPCETGPNLCQSPSKLQLGVLYAALTLVTIETAGTRVTLSSAGANQYEKRKDQGSFFNWYFLTLGFGLCAAANLISLSIFISGKRLYNHDKPMGSPFTSLIRVLVAATLKGKHAVSYKEEDYHHGKEAKTSTAIASKNFRFLNRAALKTEEDMKQSGNSNYNSWRLSSIQEVEDFKIVLRLLPLCLAIVCVSTPIAIQSSMMVLQALVTDRGLGPHFKVPAGSILVMSIISSCIFIIMNNWLVFPLYQKLAHKPLTPLQKVGIGQVFTILSMVISAVVEAKRLQTVGNEHPMSVLWLFPPLILVGIAEAFHLPANVELFYGEFPESLRNTAASLTSLVMGISYYLGTALINLIQRTTAWLPNDINHGRVDIVYWVLVIGGVLNFGYFLVCSWVYTYKNLKDDNDQKKDTTDVTT